MDIYIKCATKLENFETFEKYCLCLLDTNYFYLLSDENIEMIPAKLTEYYTMIWYIDRELPLIIPKYDNNDTIKNNLARIKGELDETKPIYAYFEIITLQGNLNQKLFNDNFFDRWEVNFPNYLLIAYYIIYHPIKAKEYADTFHYKIANLYLEDDLSIDDLKSIAYYFSSCSNYFCKSRPFFEHKIKDMYDGNFIANLDIMSYPIVYNFFNNIYKYDHTKNEIKTGTKITIGNYDFPLNSRASIEIAEDYHDNDDNILDIYLEKKSILLEKYNTEYYIDISEVLYSPDYYGFDNKSKIFYIWDDLSSAEIDLGQEYLETAFNLIVTGKFSIVNLYRNTNGNLSLFDYLKIFCIDTRIQNYMFTDLENNPDIIEFICEQKLELKYFIFEYLLHILITPQKQFFYKDLNSY